MRGSDAALAVVADLHDVLDRLAQVDLCAGADEQLLTLWRELERATRRMPTIEARPGHGSRAGALS
jgi:hypothetical protein